MRFLSPLRLIFSATLNALFSFRFVLTSSLFDLQLTYLMTVPKDSRVSTVRGIPRRTTSVEYTLQVTAEKPTWLSSNFELVLEATEPEGRYHHLQEALFC